MLTLAAFSAFMLLSPAVLLLLGMRVSSNYDLKLESDNPILQVAGLIVITTIIQVFTLPLYIWMIDAFFGIPSNSYLPTTEKDLKSFFVSKEYGFNFNRWSAIATYIGITYFVSFLIGRSIIKPIETGCIRFDFFHGPLYQLIAKNPRPSNIPCTIITKIKHENVSLMYRGNLRRIIYEGKHEIKYVILSHVYKFGLRIDSDKIKTIEEKTEVSFDKDQKNLNLLYISGEEISNILFSEFPLERKPLDEVERILSN